MKEISVGRLGTFPFPRGYFLYIGSAFGPGGLNARIRRHLRHTKRRHWHIDYLAAEAAIKDVWFSSHSDKHECRWAATLEADPQSQSPVPGFGASDCLCPSHLFYGKKKPLLTYYRNLLGNGLKRWE